MLTKVEGERLLYTITFQKELRSEEYIYLRVAFTMMLLGHTA